MTDALLVDASRPRGARGLLAFLCIEAPTHPQDPTRRLQKDLAGRGFRGRRPRLRLRATALAALSWPALGREGHDGDSGMLLLCARSPTPVCSRHVWDTSMGADGGRGCREGGPGRERPRRAAAGLALGRAALLARRDPSRPPAGAVGGRPRGERSLRRVGSVCCREGCRGRHWACAFTSLLAQVVPRPNGTLKHVGKRINVLTVNRDESLGCSRAEECSCSCLPPLLLLLLSCLFCRSLFHPFKAYGFLTRLSDWTRA